MDEQLRALELMDMVERQIAVYATRIAEQREIIEKRLLSGLDATRSKELLDLLIEVESLHVLHRDRLRAQVDRKK